MTETDEVVQAADASVIYAGYARSFRYPEDDNGVLNRTEYLDAFDQGASSRAASIHEATFVDLDSSGLFEELVRYYEHFGLRRLENAELPDHISVELEFMHFMCELEHHAMLSGLDVSSARKAQRDFIDRHIKRLLKGMLEGLRGREGNARILVESCIDFVESHRLALAADE